MAIFSTGDFSIPILTKMDYNGLFYIHLMASRRPKGSSKAPKPNKDERKDPTGPITLPAPENLEKKHLEGPSTAPAPAGPIPDAAKIPKRPKSPGDEVFKVVCKLLQPEQNHQLIDGSVEILSQHLTNELEKTVVSRLSPEERVHEMREQIKKCIESGPLLKSTQKSLIDYWENYFTQESRQLIRDELHSSVSTRGEFRKISRDLAVALNPFISAVFQKFDQEKITHLSTYIYLELGNSPTNFKSPGIDIVFKKNFMEFLTENLNKDELQKTVSAVMQNFSQVFSDQYTFKISDDIFPVLATHIWNVIEATLPN